MRHCGAISDMRFWRKYVLAALLFGAFALVSALAQTTVAHPTGTQAASSQVPLKETARAHVARSHAPATLTHDEGLSVIAAALDSRVHGSRRIDCSHLVHAIYEEAGFSYPYASSSDLYQGTDEFRRVKHPQPGDLVVWSGHVGIVVNPVQRAFFSTLSHGPGIDTYDAEYWKDRGPVRFYRYIKKKQRPSHAKPD
jgi:cell wall-associated NlpC family hydrolase